MAVDAPIYVYLDQLLSQTWVRLSENVLDRSHRAEFTTASGYQDVLQESFGSVNADDRTRAKELYNLGMLAGPLVNPREGGGGRLNVPLGWARVQSDTEVHTRLGYCAYAVGKCLSHNVHSAAVTNGLSVIAAICLLQCGVEVPGRKWLTFASVFRRISASFPRPAQIEAVVWDRWLAHGMVATLNETPHGARLIDNVINSAPISKLMIPRPSTIALEADAAKLLSHIVNGGTFVGSSREKASLFWSGTPTGNHPRGINSLARVAASDLVEAASSFEISKLSSGQESPLAALSQRDPTQAAPCVLERLRTILSQEPAAKIALETSMKTLYQGVVESLAFLAADGQASPATSRVFYAHGIEGAVVSGSDQKLMIPKIRCIAKPQVSDFVQFGSHLLHVKEVQDAGAEWRVVCRN